MKILIAIYLPLDKIAFIKLYEKNQDIVTGEDYETLA
jgi:hypothetical protein